MISVLSFGVLVLGAIFTFAVSGATFTAAGVVLMVAGLAATVLSGLRDYHRDRWREKMVEESIAKGMSTTDFADDFIVERADDEPDGDSPTTEPSTSPATEHERRLRAFGQQRGDVVSEAAFHTHRPGQPGQIPADE
jgi:hypothetical protein